MNEEKIIQLQVQDMSKQSNIVGQHRKVDSAEMFSCFGTMLRLHENEQYVRHQSFRAQLFFQFGQSYILASQALFHKSFDAHIHKFPL